MYKNKLRYDDAYYKVGLLLVYKIIIIYKNKLQYSDAYYKVLLVYEKRGVAA